MEELININDYLDEQIEIHEDAKDWLKSILQADNTSEERKIFKKCLKEVSYKLNILKDIKKLADKL